MHNVAVGFSRTTHVFVPKSADDAFLLVKGLNVYLNVSLQLQLVVHLVTITLLHLARLILSL